MCVVKHLSVFIRSAAFVNIWILHPLNVSSMPLFHLTSTATTLSCMDFRTIFCHLFREFKILLLVLSLVQNAVNTSRLFYVIFTGWPSKTEFISKSYCWLRRAVHSSHQFFGEVTNQITNFKSPILLFQVIKMRCMIQLWLRVRNVYRNWII